MAYQVGMVYGPPLARLLQSWPQPAHGCSHAWRTQPEPWSLSALLTLGASECNCHADMLGREVPALHCEALEQQGTVHLGPSRVSTPSLTDHRLGMPRSSLPLEILSLCHQQDPDVLDLGHLHKSVPR